MLHFEWPWLVLLLPVPLLIRYIIKPARRIRSALRTPFLSDFSFAEYPDFKITPPPGPLLLAASAWLLLILALMRPQWPGELVEIPVSGRDMILAVDLSGSMERQDFIINGKNVDRLTATKWVAGDFISKRIGDRIGLILFGERAYLQTPLTFDRETVRTLLNESVIGLAGKSTAIGDAIGLAVKRLRERDESNRVLILLTDGANTSGAVEPLAAAELAANEGLKIYTIGIGADEMLTRSFFGARRINPSADLDEKTLRAIADKTGGRYFRARDTGEFKNIYELLDQLEPIEDDPLKFRPYTSLYYWPLSLALLLAAAILIMRLQGRR